MPQGVSIKAVEILKPGTYWDVNGNKVVVTLDDLKELAAEYDPALMEAAIVVGHPKQEDPQYGRLVDVRIDGETLLANLDRVDTEFADILKAGRFNRRSLAFFGRKSKGNPKPGKLYPKHLGFLGAHPPAVPGLKPIAFAADDEATIIELGAPGWRLSGALRTVASVFRRWREKVIEEKGVEAADDMISAWVIDDLQAAAGDIDAADQAEHSAATPCFASPNPGETMLTPEQLAAQEAALKAREAALTAREKTIKDQEVALAAAATDRRKKDDEVFVDTLIAGGRLRPTEKADVLAELAALDDGDPVIELAAGDDGKPVKLNSHQAFRRRLGNQPKLVELGKHPDKGGPEDQVITFAAPDGYSVDTARLQLHGKAVAYQTAHPGTDYLTAVKAVS